MSHAFEIGVEQRLVRSRAHPVSPLTRHVQGAAGHDRRTCRQGRTALLFPGAPGAAVAGLIALRILGDAQPHAPTSVPTGPEKQAAGAVLLHIAPPEAVFVPGGTFAMGASDREVALALRLCQREAIADDCNEALFTDEQPRHAVTVASFFLETTEVSLEAYMHCVHAGSCSSPQYGRGGAAFGAPGRPVTFVSWQQAWDFCSFRGRRLPTEAEWEYAARGEGSRLFPWGNQYGSRLANHGRAGIVREDGSDGYSGLAPVGSYPSGSTPLGLLDLAGNVEEWVADYYEPYADTSGMPLPKPRVGGTRDRIVRGGSFLSAAPGLRATARVRRAPDSVGPDVGFRCAWSPHGSTTAAGVP